MHPFVFDRFAFVLFFGAMESICSVPQPSWFPMADTAALVSGAALSESSERAPSAADRAAAVGLQQLLDARDAAQSENRYRHIYAVVGADGTLAESPGPDGRRAMAAARKLDELAAAAGLTPRACHNS